jgi:hypothetical protein
MSNKPTTAFAFSIVGAIFVLLGGLSVMMLGAIFGTIFSFIPTFGKAVGTGISLVGAVGVLSGVVMLAGAVLMYILPEKHAIWGGLTLVFSCVSWIGAFGGFAIGFVLGLVGGILGIVWKPSEGAIKVPVRNVTPSGQRGQAQQQQQRLSRCSSCGTPLVSGATACKQCGAPV